MPTLLAKTALWIALLAACLLFPVGSVDWPRGWAVLACYGLVVVAAFVVVDPELLRERASPRFDSESFDAALGGVSGLLLYPATLVVAGLDYANGWSLGLSEGLSTLALIGFAVGYAIVLWSMHANRFFTTFVRIQNDREHRVVDSGPYAWVRHPGYAGTMLAHLAMPLALGSWWALAPAGLGSLLLVPRMLAEEQTLAAGLPGYPAYRRRVRWRIVPGVW